MGIGVIYRVLDSKWDRMGAVRTPFAICIFFYCSRSLKNSTSFGFFRHC